MKQIFSIILILSVLTAIAQGNTEQALLKNINALNNAIFVNRDSMALQKLIGEKVTYGHSSAKIEGKAEMIHNAMVSPTTYKDFGMTDVVVNIEGSTAIVRHVLKARSFDAQGKEGALHLNVLQTWMKKGKQWLLIARQAVKVP